MAPQRTLSLLVLLACSAAGTAPMSAEAVSRRLAALPAYQLARYGKTASEQKKNFVEQVLVPEMLYGEEALKRKMDESPALRDKLREALRDAMDRALRADTLAKEPITTDE